MKVWLLGNYPTAEAYGCTWTTTGRTHSHAHTMSNRTSHRNYRKQREAIKAQRPVCWLCLESIDYTLTDHLHPGYFTLDHVEAVAAGGPAVYGAQLRAAHRLCNLTRGAKPGVEGMYAGRRPQGKTSTVIPGSRKDPQTWTDEARPVDGHTIFPETRCSNCPCYRSRWWLGGYQEEYDFAVERL